VIQQRSDGGRVQKAQEGDDKTDNFLKLKMKIMADAKKALGPAGVGLGTSSSRLELPPTLKKLKAS